MGVEAEFPGMMLSCFILVAVVYAAVIWLLSDKIPRRCARGCFIGQWVLTCMSFFFLYCITGRRRALPAALTGNVNLTVILSVLCWGLSILLMLVGCILLIKQRNQRKEG